MQNEVLLRVRELLIRGWSRQWAETAGGTQCHPCDPRAASWSVHGAVLRAQHDLGLDASFYPPRERLRDYFWEHHKGYLTTLEWDATIGLPDVLNGIHASLD